MVLNKQRNIAYMLNAQNSTISVCSVYSDGTINTCTPHSAGGLLRGPQGANVNSTGTVVYVANYDAATGISKVVFYQILPNGNLGGCQQTIGNGTFNFSNNDVTNLFVGNAFGYIPNGGGVVKSISICPLCKAMGPWVFGYLYYQNRCIV